MKKTLTFFLSIIFIITLGSTSNLFSLGFGVLNECAAWETCAQANPGGGGSNSGDTIYPNVYATEDNIVLYINQLVPDWTSYFSAYDNVDGEIEITSANIDENVNTSVIGDYTVTAIVHDSSNNIKGKTIQVKVLPYIVNTGILVQIDIMGAGVEIYNQTEFVYETPTWELWTIPSENGIFRINYSDEIYLKSTITGDYYSFDNMNREFPDGLSGIMYQYEGTVEEFFDQNIRYSNIDFKTSNVPEHHFFKYTSHYAIHEILYDLNASPYNFYTFEEGDYPQVITNCHAYLSTDGKKILLTQNTHLNNNGFGLFLIADKYNYATQNQSGEYTFFKAIDIGVAIPIYKIVTNEFITSNDLTQYSSFTNVIIIDEY